MLLQMRRQHQPLSGTSVNSPHNLRSGHLHKPASPAPTTPSQCPASTANVAWNASNTQPDHEVAAPAMPTWFLVDSCSEPFRGLGKILECDGSLEVAGGTRE